MYKHIYSSSIPTHIKHATMNDIINCRGRHADFVNCGAAFEEADPAGRPGQTVSDPALC